MEAVIVVLSAFFPVLPQAGETYWAAAPSPRDLKKLSLEELMEIEVTLVSRKSEKLTEAASAIQVITSEEIRRSGAVTLPEALALASNLHVARINAHDFAISARGFNDRLANKMLVMIDGRVLYTPLYAGVFWDAQHAVLDNIERIEVISGPGGALWGANAVNGVINIVTKDAASTAGAFIEAGVGTFQRDFAALRYGGKLGKSLHYRVHGQRLDNNPSLTEAGDEAGDGWSFDRGGIRMDWDNGGRDRVAVMGELDGGALEQPASRVPGMGGDVELSSQYVQARWTREISETSAFEAKGYFYRTWRDIPLVFKEDLRVWDFDFMHRFALGGRNVLMWGGNYRLMVDDVGNGAFLAFLPPEKNMHLQGGFLQDQASFLRDRLRITAGIKVEHNDFTGLEWMPSGRAAFSASPDHLVWAAVSRAVRAPSRIDVDFYLPVPPVQSDTVQRLDGGPDFGSEYLVAYEAGWRGRPVKTLSVSVSAFAHDFQGLRILKRVDSVTFQIDNGLEGLLFGLEVSGDWQAASWWRLRGGYTYFMKDLDVAAGLRDYAQAGGRGSDPGYQALFQSFLDLPKGFELNATARLVDAVPTPYVPGFLVVDAGAGWRQGSVELSIHGRNLAGESHAEFGSSGARREIPRSVLGRMAWRF